MPNPDRRQMIAGLTASVALAPAALRAETLSPTARDMLGPYYVSGMPVLENINRFGKSGEPVLVTGRARSTNGAPLAGARVEMWHTDSTGRYYPMGNGAVADYADSALDLRGATITDSEGRFSYRSVVPAPYPGRPPHIHYVVSAPGHETLITQHYVASNGVGYQPRDRHVSVARAGGEARLDSPDFILKPL